MEQADRYHVVGKWRHVHSQTWKGCDFDMLDVLELTTKIVMCQAAHHEGIDASGTNGLVRPFWVVVSGVSICVCGCGADQ